MLSAVEGLKVVEPSLEEAVVPVTAVIIVLLFLGQRFGTAAVGRLFGPVMVLLATAATVIASQAVITGAFSVACQAVQLGYLPRLRISHTSPETIGQIYVPWINWTLMVSVLTLVSTIELRRGERPSMPHWRTRLFIATSQITADAAEFFGLPRDRTVIIGSHVDV